MSEKQYHIITLLVENKPGVLQHIAGLFTRRCFNIDSLTVGESEQEGLSRMTIISYGDEKILEQIKKQLNKLVPVIKVRHLPKKETVLRELCLIKVKTANEEERNEIMQFTQIFRGSIVDVTKEAVIIEVTGDSEKINALIELAKPFGILKTVRTGVSAIPRGVQAPH